MSLRRGLTLGKFAPLHRGHQLVIETGIAETDEMSVIIYDATEVTKIPLAVRAGWIRTLYPTVRVIEAWDGPTEVGYTHEIMRAQEKYVIETLGVRGISHFYSSERYGEHMSEALGAVDRRVDSARATMPVSGTAIRSDPYENRHYVPPQVYRDLIINIVFLGAPSTGKTTLAQALAAKYHTEWMPEYGREFWERHQVDRRLSPEQLVRIAETHVVRENALLEQANRYLFTDTSALTTAMFARYYHGSMLPELAHLADLAAARYDLVFLCDTDILYDDTADRSGAANRAAFQRQIIGDLAQRKIPYFTLRGSLAERIDRVSAVLARFEKYGNALELLASPAP